MSFDPLSWLESPRSSASHPLPSPASPWYAASASSSPVGVLCVVLIGVLALPAALMMLPPRPSRMGLARSRPLTVGLEGVARICTNRPLAVVLVALAIAMAAGLSASRIEVDSSGPNAFAQDSKFRRAMDFYRDHLSGDVVENIYLDGVEGSFKEPAQLERLRALQRDAEALPEIDTSISIADYIELMHRAMTGDGPGAGRVPDSREAVAQYLLLYSISGDLSEFDDIIDTSYSQARIILKARVGSSRESAALRARLAKLVARHFPEVDATPAVLSTEILLSKASDLLAIEQVRSFGIALMLILATVMLAFRSPDGRNIDAAPESAAPGPEFRHHGSARNRTQQLDVGHRRDSSRDRRRRQCSPAGQLSASRVPRRRGAPT